MTSRSSGGARIEDADLDRVIPSAALGGDGGLAIPGSEKILAMLIGETALMCVPLWIAKRGEAEGLAGRLWTIARSCRPYLDGQESQLFSGSRLTALEEFQPAADGEPAPEAAAGRSAASRGVPPHSVLL